MAILLYPLTTMWGLLGAGFAILLAVLLVFPYLIHILHNKTDLKLEHFLLSSVCCVINVMTSVYVCNLFDLNTGWVFLLGVGLCVMFSVILFLIIYKVSKIGPGLIVLETLLSLYKR